MIKLSAPPSASTPEHFVKKPPRRLFLWPQVTAAVREFRLLLMQPPALIPRKTFVAQRGNGQPATTTTTVVGDATFYKTR
jgi:hypothetical protein